MNGPRLQVLLLAAALPLLGAWAGSRPQPGSGVPARIPLPEAQPWMADCLPGVGVKTRERVAAALRAGRWDAVPARSRGSARAWFSAPPARH